ncbi:hypothetical protein [Curtobacterium flaccumfaciens]|uniref:hypothetical protein n=1 Tax=Curtobacterium flaccumfaciens TaxID=2035 RepID=UPI000FFE3585|nr:hypothetical protein [Curtobacterium flaccumfaciens]MCS0646677.1 hypothetical protein [Curtobacterium flaccumfaciens pv. flaccumfaciens]MCS6525948.1 hypothetical protein [Curtobacterium flaccumfaciens pv. flaccumfaciens]MCS6528697.1 hypothetical protein [Curtobacterium flaccumfaciens pv. flaccumfaciens]NUU11396.1 hypothetical protein [Curtobacterium flaccumfaciens]RXF85295.1 hypothetical protein CffCFBP3418_00185 [Curtobacterium flaccumfaciens pv. flaccumfaciens]
MTTATETPETPETIARRAWRRTAWIILAGGIVGLMVGVVVVILLGDARRGPGWPIVVVGCTVAVGGLAGAFSLVATTLRLTPQMQAPLEGLSRFGRKTLAQAIAKQAPIEPADSDLARRAVDIARLRAAYQPIALGQFLLLCLGIVGPQLPNLVGDDPFSAVFSRILCGTLLVAAVVFTPLFLHQSRSCRRYVQAATEAAARQR